MSNSEKYWVVIPAAGIGSRMQAACPKQYLELLGRPVLLHALERLGSCPGIAGVGLGISPADTWWPKLGYDADWLVRVCEGGAERADTVSNVLESMQDLIAAQDWVLVHDAARPCVTHDEVLKLIEQGSKAGGGLLGRTLTDTIKQADAAGRVQQTIPREGLWRAQTPQMFRYAELRAALRRALESGSRVTDEASAMELAGIYPVMVEGRPDNIKITRPGDLEVAEFYLQQQGFQ
jgi:2-C-methyl-D-erythritol 4-phosphate cytidylyltransferase